MSHIRITVKDDNRGLGAKSGFIDEDRPNPGLDGLQDLLGRLNGKDNPLLQAEERSRAVSRTATYAGRRWGLSNFVSGGFLVGDRPQLPKNLDADESSIDTDIINPGTCQAQDHKVAKVSDGKRRNAHSVTGCVEPGLKALRIQRPIQNSERKAHRRSRRAEKVARRALEEPGHGLCEGTVQDCAGTARMTQAPQTTRAYGRRVGRHRSIQHGKNPLMDQKALNEVCGFTMSLFHC